MDNHKVCPDCKQMLSVDQFHKHGKYLQPRCKACTKKRVASRKAAGLIITDPQHSLIASEQDVIAQLNKRGIPAQPAKALAHSFGDIIAWGCVPIEVKSASYIDGEFSWGFSPRQRKGGIRGMFVVLVCYKDGEEPRYHIFDAKHPWFYNNGKLKAGIGYKPVRANGGRKRGISDQEFENSRDAWHLIEARFNHVVLRLRSGAPMTEFLQPTK